MESPTDEEIAAIRESNKRFCNRFPWFLAAVMFVAALCYTSYRYGRLLEREWLRGRATYYNMNDYLKGRLSQP